MWDIMQHYSLKCPVYGSVSSFQGCPYRAGPTHIAPGCIDHMTIVM